MKRQFTAPVKTCARCGHNHARLLFKRLNNHEKYTHWGMCPRLEQPILMQIVDTGKKVQTPAAGKTKA